MEEMFLPSVEFPGVPPPRPVDYEDKAVASYPPNLPGACVCRCNDEEQHPLPTSSWGSADGRESLAVAAAAEACPKALVSKPVELSVRRLGSLVFCAADVNDPQALAQFARSYMTSLGHLYGSAQMGKVVDDKFRVVGVEGLSVVDASILPQLTRMNPALTLMALGRWVQDSPPRRERRFNSAYDERRLSLSRCAIFRYAGQMLLGI